MKTTMSEYMSRKLNLLTKCSIIALALLSTGCMNALVRGDTDTESSPALPEPTIDALIAEGDKALRTGDIDTAQVNYALAVEKDNTNVDALFKLALVHQEKDSLKVAESLLHHAIAADKRHLASKLLLAKMLVRLSRVEEAKRLFLNVLDTNPKSIDALNGLGVLADMSADHKQAQIHFLDALMLDSRSEKLANNLGFSYYLDGNYQNAEEYFQKSIEYNPDYHKGWSNLALLYSKTERLRAADAAFRKLVSEHQSANNIGYLSLLEGKTDLALAQFSRAIDSAPSYYELANRNLNSLKE